jgi:hypothetical protein
MPSRYGCGWRYIGLRRHPALELRPLNRADADVLAAWAVAVREHPAQSSVSLLSGLLGGSQHLAESLGDTLATLEYDHPDGGCPKS